MRTVCGPDMCAGCRLCADICPAGAVRIEERPECCAAFIDEEKCIRCGICHRYCPQDHMPPLRRPVVWYQGWSNDEVLRRKSSSGGLAAGIMKGFLLQGGEICTCVCHNGEFRFAFLQEISQIEAAVGSKYIKSNPSGIYQMLRDKLEAGKKELMIGLPCQVAAARNYIGDMLSGDLFAVDLICHGTPASGVLQMYLKNRRHGHDRFDDLSFRDKNRFRLCLDDEVIEERYMDEYTYTFLRGLIYTENCYRCPYARLERTGDVTLGDSWGSDLPEEEQKKGISLILCQTDKGRELLSYADAALRAVDIDRAVAANEQLRHPFEKPLMRDLFLKGITNERSFEQMLWIVDPVQAVKNRIKKTVLTRMGGVR